MPQGGQTGWGAICGFHADRGGGPTACKKSVSIKSLDHGSAVLRLKRWLLAGLQDEDWPVHRKRSHHVSLGGPHLRDFAVGLSEEEMDMQVEMLTSRDA